MKLTSSTQSSGHELAFTMAEQLVAMAVSLILVSAIVSGFVQTTRQAEWSAYSLAAQSLANQCLEQSRAAKWDPKGYPAVDQLVSSNFPLSVQILDIPLTRSNIVYATNLVTITTISSNPGLKMIAVQCTWPFADRGIFTNTVASYRAADQ